MHFSIDYFQPSLDGKLVIYGISPDGSEESILHVVETDSGRILPERIDRTRFGIVGWLPGNRSFFYNRLQKLTPDMPRTAFEQRSRVYVHEVGQDPDNDRFVFGYGYSPDVKVNDNDISFLAYTPLSPYVFAGLAHGTQNRGDALLRSPREIKPAPGGMEAAL